MKPASAARIGLTGGKLVERRANNELDAMPKLFPNVVCHEPVDAEHVRGEKGGEAQEIVSHHSIVLPPWRVGALTFVVLATAFSRLLPHS